MSTLTKVLIVLLTVFSIFLCGIVVTYVANADNQRERAETLQRNIGAAKSSQTAALQDLEAEKQRAQAEKNKLDAQISELGVRVSTLQTELESLKRENNQLVQRVASMGGAVENANATAQQQTKLFEAAQQEVRSLRAEQTNRQTELDETNQMLLAKLGIISDLEKKIRQLTEENQELTSRANQYLQQYGRMAAKPATTVPPVGGAARPAMPAQTRKIDLNGQITAIDLKSKLAEISIGTAAGVQQDMQFHVTRGDQFVADITILEVWPDKAVGLVQRVQPGMLPQTGDKIATNL